MSKRVPKRKPAGPAKKKVERNKTAIAVVNGEAANGSAVASTAISSFREIIPDSSTFRAALGGRSHRQEEGSTMVTYFLCTDKRGIDYFRITGKVLRSYLRGFRAVVVTTEPIVGVVSPDLKWIEVVGQVWGDHFRFGRQWAKRDILQELEAEYLQGGAGTHSQRRKAIEDYERAVAALEAHRESIAALKRNLSEASANLVRRVGRGEVELCGKLCGPSYRRDTVFWRPQPESDAKSVVVVEAEPEQEVFERLSQEAAEG